MTAWLATSFFQWAACLAVALPLSIAAWRSAARQARKPINRPVIITVAALSLFFLISLLVVHSGLAWNILPDPWQGHTLLALFSLVVILATRQREQAGLTTRVNPGGWRASMIVTAGLLAYIAMRAAGLRMAGLSAAGAPPGTEFLLFQATLPGLAEELAYRGVIQPGLDRVWPPRWNVLGARVGWGWLVTSIIFWGIHAFRYDAALVFSFYWPTLTFQLIAGLVFGWIRARSGNLLPSIIAHNLANLAWSLA